MIQSRMRHLAALAAFGCLSALSSTAAAKPNFTGQISTYLNLSYVPPCSICHIDGVTGGQTVVTPFGYSMVSHGLSGGRSGVTAALDAMKQSGVDSDGDRISDIDELIAGTDPNSAANGSLSGQTPSAGCSVTQPGPDSGALFAAATLAVALLATRRRRA